MVILLRHFQKIPYFYFTVFNCAGLSLFVIKIFAIEVTAHSLV